MTDEESRKAWEEWSTDYLKRYGWPKHIGAIAWQAAWTEATRRERERCAALCRTAVDEANAQPDAPGIPGIAVMKAVRAATASEILQHVRSGQEPKP